MPNRFRYQVDVIAFDIGFDVFSKTWPIVFPTNQLPDFIDIKMTYNKIMVVSTDQIEIDDF